MSILEKIKTVGRFTKRITRGIVYGAGLAVLVGIVGMIVHALYHSSPLPTPKQLEIQHEVQAQASELKHRVQVCNDMIDSMTPQFQSGAAFHCTQMWLQMKKLHAFVDQMNNVDPEINSVIESSFRTAARYAEYQKALNSPTFRSSPSEE